MVTLGMSGTKWDIFATSIDLFSKIGYTNVSLRDIAKEVGIKASSIYNHFSLKDDILLTIYNFYEENYKVSLPNINELVDLIGKIRPQEIFDKCNFFYEKDLQTHMDRIVIIAQEEKNRDKRAEDLIKNVFIETPKEILRNGYIKNGGNESCKAA